MAPWISLLAVVLAMLALAGCGGSGKAVAGNGAPRNRAGAGVAAAVGLRAGSGCGVRPPVAPGGVGEIRVPVAPRIALGAHHRIAFIHVASGYRSDTPMPLVLEFHGASPHATAAGYLRGSPLDRLADRAGFLDVFPQRLRYPNGNLAWNAYGPVLSPVTELPFVERLIDPAAAHILILSSRERRAARGCRKSRVRDRAVPGRRRLA